MRKRRPLAKLIGDLATGKTPRTPDRSPASPTVAERVSTRKPLARIGESARLLRESRRRLAGSQIMMALAKTQLAEVRRRSPTVKRPPRAS